MTRGCDTCAHYAEKKKTGDAWCKAVVMRVYNDFTDTFDEKPFSLFDKRPDECGPDRSLYAPEPDEPSLPLRPYLIPLGSLIALGLLSVALIAVFEWR